MEKTQKFKPWKPGFLLAFGPVSTIDVSIGPSTLKAKEEFFRNTGDIKRADRYVNLRKVVKEVDEVIGWCMKR